MNRIMPAIHESADELKTRLQQEHDHRKRQRLHMLYLLASGQARRGHVAQLLGVDRNTIGRWLTRYTQGGLAARLAVYVPAGKAPALAPAPLTQM